MRSLFLFGIICLSPFAFAGDQSRSYVFTGIVQPSDCGLLPRSSFEILPSLARVNSGDRLFVTCERVADGSTLLTLTFRLTDAPLALQPGQQRRYSFRWGAGVAEDGNVAEVEFSRDEGQCRKILNMFEHARQQSAIIGPAWEAGCFAEDRWGEAMEITVVESTR